MNKDIFDIFKKGGVILAPPQPTDAIYEIVFGAEAPQEAFNWEQYLPVPEWQKSTTGCVSFSRLNCAETLAKKEGLDLNLSDRHLFVLSGTTKAGNNLNAVSEAFRTLGIVREEYFPWKPEYLENQSVYWQEIFDTSSIPSEARRFLGGNHCWVNGKSAIRSALAYSPLQIAFPVYETYLFHTNDIIKKGKEVLVYHAVELYWIDLEGNYYIYDSAGDRNPFKVLDKDYPITQCKSFRDLPESWKLTQQQLNERKEKTILAIIQEILKKIALVLGLMGEKIKIITPLPVEILDPDIFEPPPKDMVVKMADAITEFEGWYARSRSQRNNNPGNLKFTLYTKSLGAIGFDEDNFCKFSSYDSGFSALCQFIKDAGNNKLKRYHDCTIKSFFEVYSDNAPNYANFIAQHLGVDILTKIADLVDNLESG